MVFLGPAKLCEFFSINALFVCSPLFQVAQNVSEEFKFAQAKFGVRNNYGSLKVSNYFVNFNSQ